MVEKIRIDWYEQNNIDISKSVGIDEVGRGPLAGPVVVAAVWISDAGVKLLRDSDLAVRDSKKMTEAARQKVVDFLNTLPADIAKISIAQASVGEIDSLNILQATMLAMQRVYRTLKIHPKFVLVDGNRAPDISNTQVVTITKGDDKVLAISLASIVAKQYRDHLMRKLAIEYPQYGWDTNVGYGTKQHIEAIYTIGVTEHHRKSFSPIKEIIKKPTSDPLD